MRVLKFAWLILGGRAILFYKPALPWHLLWAHDKIQATESTTCARTNDLTNAELTALKEDSDLLTRSILAILPEDHCCTNNMDSDLPLNRNVRIKITMREVTAELGIKSGLVGQRFYLGYYVLRSIGASRKLGPDEDEEGDDLADLFQGMKNFKI